MAPRTTRRRRGKDASITAKQQMVIEAAEAGGTIQSIARRMNIGTPGVYGHLRKLREKGINLDVPTGSESVAEVAASNGHLLASDIEEPTEIQDLDARVTEAIRNVLTGHDQYVEALDIEIEQIETKLVGLKAQRENADKKRDRYKRAVETCFPA